MIAEDHLHGIPFNHQTSTINTIIINTHCTMSTTTTSLPYREQVNDMLVALSNIGKPVWVLFQHGKSNKHEFFRGEITEISMKKVLDEQGEEDTTGISLVDIQHFVVFDDGDRDWYNLAEKEDAGQLMWQEPVEKILLKPRVVVKNSKATMKPQKTSSLSSSSAAAAAALGRASQQGNKTKRKIDSADETDDDDDYYEESDDYKIRNELNNHSGKKRARVVVCSSDSSADARNNNNNNQQKEQASVARRQFQALGSTTRKWIKLLGLTKAYGLKHDALNIIMDNPSIYVMPEAFEQVFYLTDFLFPGKDYHQTLYARYTTKPGKPVRDVLLDLKRENPQDPLISWHEKCGKWIPPTASVCVGMIKLIQEMI